MQSPAAKDIRARWIRKRIRSDGEEDDRIEIENIEAVKSITDQEAVDFSDDSSDLTVTEDKKESPRSGGGEEDDRIEIENIEAVKINNRSRSSRL